MKKWEEGQMTWGTVLRNFLERSVLGKLLYFSGLTMVFGSNMGIDGSVTHRPVLAWFGSFVLWVSGRMRKTKAGV